MKTATVMRVSKTLTFGMHFPASIFLLVDVKNTSSCNATAAKKNGHRNTNISGVFCSHNDEQRQPLIGLVPLTATQSAHATQQQLATHLGNGHKHQRAHQQLVRSRRSQ